jgi:hypothetical protein
MREYGKLIATPNDAAILINPDTFGYRKLEAVLHEVMHFEDHYGIVPFPNLGILNFNYDHLDIYSNVLPLALELYDAGMRAEDFIGEYFFLRPERWAA